MRAAGTQATNVGPTELRPVNKGLSFVFGDPTPAEACFLWRNDLEQLPFPGDIPAQGNGRSAMTTTFEDLASKLKKIDFCMLSTNSGAGRISTRPMSNNGDVEYDGDSWFFSYEDTRKVSEINAIDGVSLTFTEPPSLLGKPGIFIAIQGTASIIRNKEMFKEHWVSGLERWFPERAETPGLILIRVSATSIYYWDGEENGEVDIPGK